uniref:Protocadherin gamma-C3 n=1 Tax=Geotrypetes seraphini TaxID=260995 RepID=A0A6P8Q814_GEOSA|nr:protocadherin alpha-4-like isoform X3 [Geotrypetes seraphini]
MYNRNFRIAYETSIQYFGIDIKHGILFIKHKIDREHLCVSSSSCLINLEAVMDKPLEVYRIQVEILDINDNSPHFLSSENAVTVSEFALPGTHFPLEGALDKDVGENALLSYHLSANEFFAIDHQMSEGKSTSLELRLLKALDREQRSVHQLTLTATDGGAPKRTGTTQITIQVRDANDNPPVFDHSSYKVKMLENTPLGSLVIQLNATDLDEGENGDVVYSFTNLTLAVGKQLFSIDPNTGEIRVQGVLDFERSNTFEIRVQAKDRGLLQLTGRCSVTVELVDVNDNSPEIKVTSFSNPVQEDALPGLVIALFTVTDKDSGVNGKVSCEVPLSLPFQIEAKFENYYALVLKESLDRETTAEYHATILATDGGSPPLSAVKTIVIVVADVNDNPPTFLEVPYVVTIAENNVPGSPIFRVSALDHDFEENGEVKYSIIESTEGVPIPSMFSVRSDTGHVFALLSFDYERNQVLSLRIEARDSGSPSLSSTAEITLFIQDQNDNHPVLLPPFPSRGSSASEVVSLSRHVGYLVAKIRAVDADSGYNAWLSYEFKEPTNADPFRIGLYTGEIRTIRSLRETDEGRKTLTILVKDHGNSTLSATITLTVLLEKSNQEEILDFRHVPNNDNYPTDLNVYLIISIASISGIFLFIIFVYIILRYQKARTDTKGSKKTEVCPDTAGKWTYSQSQQYYLYLSGESKGNRMLRSQSPHYGWNNENNRTPTGDLLQLHIGENAVTKATEPKQPNPDWRYSASMRAGMQSAVHLDESGVLRGGPGGPEQQWPTVSSATLEPEAGEVSPPVGAGVNSNSWTFKYGPGNPKQPVPPIPPDFPDNFIIPGSPAIISIRQDQQASQGSKGNFITFGKKEETKKRKKKKKQGSKNQEKKEKGNSATDNSDQ